MMQNNRVGILTFHYANNYGAVLQTYALSEQIKRLGYAPFVINKGPTRGLRERSIVVYSRLRRWCRRGRGDGDSGAAFEAFRKQHLDIAPAVTQEATVLREMATCSAIIVGSDQVWNVAGLLGRVDPFYFLRIPLPREITRVSYAACFGQPSQPKRLYAQMADGFSQFSRISVRNGFSARLVKEICGLDVPVVVDPTLLLDAAAFPCRTKPGTVGCIVLYFLSHSHGVEIDNIVAYVRSRWRMPVYSISSRDCCPQADVYLEDVGPGEFYDLIRNATFVLTDSFHGTVLSVKFRRSFVAMERGERFARIRDFLAQYGLENRSVSVRNWQDMAHALSEAPDYSMTEKRLKADIESSIAFLRDALA